jgi:hypothetical protein
VAIPEAPELDALAQAVADAELLATLGKEAAGFLHLLAGRRRAEAAQAAGAAWGEELVRRYQWAMDRYERRHPLRP